MMMRFYGFDSIWVCSSSSVTILSVLGSLVIFLVMMGSILSVLSIVRR